MINDATVYLTEVQGHRVHLENVVISTCLSHELDLGALPEGLDIPSCKECYCFFNVLKFYN